MVNIENKQIEKIEKYPKEIENSKIGKIIWDSLRYGDLTKTVLKNKIYETVLKEFSDGKDLEEVIVELMNKGLIKRKKKQTEITIFSNK